MNSKMLDGLHNLKVLVVGDLMIDHYMWGKFERISPEAPVPIIDYGTFAAGARSGVGCWV